MENIIEIINITPSPCKKRAKYNLFGHSKIFSLSNKARAKNVCLFQVYSQVVVSRWFPDGVRRRCINKLSDKEKSVPIWKCKRIMNEDRRASSIYFRMWTIVRVKPLIRKICFTSHGNSTAYKSYERHETILSKLF